MIRLALVSDSHGALFYLNHVARAFEGCAALCHLGDMTPDAKNLAARLGAPLHAVRGNCDIAGDAPEEITLSVAGYKLLLCHGHRYGVKHSLTALSLRAQAAGADVVLYGHTHIPQIDRDGRMLFVNPGALCDGRFATLEFRENGPVALMRTL